MLVSTASIQADLGLVMQDPKEARRTVYEYFEAYRKCVQLLGRDFVQHAKQVTAPGYSAAMDPDLIRVIHVHAEAPRAWSDPQDDEDLLSGRERDWLRFVRRIDRRVERLPASHNDLIRHRFLDHDPTPTDDETFAWWEGQGWAYSFRKFEQIKREAVQMVAAGLGVDA